jgi:hypothetical protein
MLAQGELEFAGDQGLAVCGHQILKNAQLERAGPRAEQARMQVGQLHKQGMHRAGYGATTAPAAPATLTSFPSTFAALAAVGSAGAGAIATGPVRVTALASAAT